MDVPSFIISYPNFVVEHRCGYCNGKKSPGSTSNCIYISAYYMKVDIYDQLMNLGFRRSGDTYYKSDLLTNCCKIYTIRTSLDMFTVQKSQRKCINRFIRAIQDQFSSDGGLANSERNFDISKLIVAEKSSSRFKFKFEKADFTKEKYDLYKKYVIKVHDHKEEEVTERGFRSFLCQSSLEAEDDIVEDKELWKTLNNWQNIDWNTVDPTRIRKIHSLGSVHENYYLDNKLIAISVVDFLPSGLSSVYFIWDPDYHHLSLGILSAMRDLLLVYTTKWNHYYLGLYIDDCPKMRYKRSFGGELLDLSKGIFIPFKKFDEIVKSGKDFFVTSYEDTKEPLREPEKDFNGLPSSYNGPVFDISENIYGENGGAFAESSKCHELLSKEMGISDVDSPTYKSIPSVAPGLMPLWQFKELLESEELSNLKVKQIFVDHVVRHRRTDFQSLGHDKQAVSDCIRLFGLELFKKCAVVPPPVY